MSKDAFGDIRQLVTPHIKYRSLSIISRSGAGDATQAETMDEMSVEDPLDKIDIDMNMEIMVEDEMQAAM